jgi:DNA-binding SARP family transcriptional activator
MVALNVRLFGRFEAWYEGQPVQGLNARRAREVFSYLLLHRDRPHLRETLADLLWEDAAPAQSRKYLRQALWQVQAALQFDEEGSDLHALQVDPEWIQLNSCSQIEVDVARFDEATRGCYGIPGSRLSDAQRQQLEGAVDLYCDDLLGGWYQDWCVFERERLQNAFLEALEKLVSCCEARGDSERGLAHAHRMLAIDPAREQVHCHIMRLHVLAGNRTEALREYQRCEKVLMQELAVRPSESTRALHESIRSGQCDSTWLGYNPIDAAAMANLPLDRLSALVEYLEQMQSTFAGIVARLRQDMPPTDSGEAR